MARKKQLDKLSLDMIECEKAGFGVSYGKWYAAQEHTPVDHTEGLKACKRCGKLFKPKTTQLYCDADCQYLAKLERKRKVK